MNKPKLEPPRWAERFLKWYCKPEVLEDLQGDLREYFVRHVHEVGPRKAKVNYLNVKISSSDWPETYQTTLVLRFLI